MRGLRLILFAYCLLAALAGTIGIVLFGSQLSAEGRAISTAQAELNQLEQRHEDARDELLALREKQRLERDDYSAQQAIEASAATQVAIEKEAALQLELDMSRQANEGARSALQKRQTQLIPLLALTLLHWLLCPLVYRRKGQA